MKRSNRLLILVGVVLAVIVGVGVVWTTGGSSKNTPSASSAPVTTGPVVVAKTDISIGTRITAAMVESQQKEKTLITGDMFGDPGLVIGLTAGGNISKGQIISSSRDFPGVGVVSAGQDLAPGIEAGMRAVSIEVDQINGVGTLLQPGDHVDVVLTVYTGEWKSIKPDASAKTVTVEIVNPGYEPTSKVVIQNRKILATLLPPTQTQANAPATTPQPSAQKQADTVSLNNQHMVVVMQVTLQEAELIRWAQRMEKTDPQNYIDLGLALRSDKDANAQAADTTTGIVLKVLVDKYGVLPPDWRPLVPKDLQYLLTAKP